VLDGDFSSDADFGRRSGHFNFAVRSRKNRMRARICALAELARSAVPTQRKLRRP
jgi:hypothetical protein